MNRFTNALVAGSQSLSTRRLVFFFGAIILFSSTFILFAPSQLSPQTLHDIRLPESVADVTEHVPSFHVPNPFAPAIHNPPPVADSTNSTASSSKWYSSFTWLNPFTSHHDKEDRIAIPNLERRCPIYTFYDSSAKDEKASVEDKLLLAWRRAWWAHGFKPVILGMAEAKSNGIYEKVMRDRLKGEWETEVMKWLAWAQMGRGIMADYRVFPMASRDDFAISALRRCDFAYMTRYKGLEGRLYAGDKPSIEAVVKQITSIRPADVVTKVEEALKEAENAENLFRVEAIPSSMADYTPENIKERYGNVPDESLPLLINSHLHSTFLSHYPEGISVLVPFSIPLAPLTQPAKVLAHRIASCPQNDPKPGYCPPNLPKCTPCSKTTAINFPTHFTNSTKAFVLATVPHPFVTVQMTHDDADLAEDDESKLVRFIRRKTKRDVWLKEATEGLVDSKFGATGRLQEFKHAVAASRAEPFVSLWTIGELGFKNTEWDLGFELPTTEELKVEIPKPEQSRVDRFMGAQKARKSRTKINSIVEEWNLGDTESWKFVNAIEERKVVERRKWSHEEKAFGRGLSGEEKR